MGATDICGLLESVDHWTETGLETLLIPALLEQQCPSDAREMLAQAFKEQTGHLPGEGPTWRGAGWRVWYGNGTWLDSRATRWEDVPDGIVVGVSYSGYRRWMAHGVDPYWRGVDGLIYDGRHSPDMPPIAPLDGLRKQGVWVTDEEMRQARWRAALAFVL